MQIQFDTDKFLEMQKNVLSVPVLFFRFKLCCRQTCIALSFFPALYLLVMDGAPLVSYSLLTFEDVICDEQLAVERQNTVASWHGYYCHWQVHFVHLNAPHGLFCRLG